MTRQELGIKVQFIDEIEQSAENEFSVSYTEKPAFMKEATQTVLNF